MHLPTRYFAASAGTRGASVLWTLCLALCAAGCADEIPANLPPDYTTDAGEDADDDPREPGDVSADQGEDLADAGDVAPDTSVDVPPDADAADVEPDARDADAEPDLPPESCDPPPVTALFDENTPREPELQRQAEDALITTIADRARDRHAREDVVNGIPFRRYDHYLPFYWEQRVANIEIIDRVAMGGSDVTFRFTTLDRLNPAEFRAFYSGVPAVAVYHSNQSDMVGQGVTLVGQEPSARYPGETEYTYTATLGQKLPERRPLEVGDRIEFELSQFLARPRNGRTNYYGTALLYVVGDGIVPWYAKAKEEAATPAEAQRASFDSHPIPESAWLGGGTTLSYPYSNEPRHRFKQTAGNLSPRSGHAFMLGRRLHHTDFASGAHSEAGNPDFGIHAGKAGPIAVTHVCVSCHVDNGRDVPAPVGGALRRAVVKVGDDAGRPHPTLGDSIQPGGEIEADGAPFLRREAEDYTSHEGIMTEPTSDLGGGVNIGFVDPGDKLVYADVDVDGNEPGLYLFSARLASEPGGGRFVVTGPAGEPAYAVVDVPSTGGWQTWVTVSVPLRLRPGAQTLELHAEIGGWNLNWFELSHAESSGQEGAAIVTEYELVDGEYGDGAPFTLRRPVYAFEGTAPEHFSVRLAPQLVGLGLLEAIDEEQLLALADPCDEDEDGISGRLRAVSSGDGLLAGRFGYKSGQPSVTHQIAAALNRDMGVTTSLFPLLDGEEPGAADGREPELGPDDLELMRRYVALLGVPAQRGLSNPEVARGQQLFDEAGCAGCHTATFTTSPNHPFAELRSQTIHPYTDLLLHDMGPGLADSLGLPGATAREWRTAPLWGVGLAKTVNDDAAFLHDGRARTLAEAILWHGGEGESSKERFRTMPADDRAALLLFLESL